MGELLTVGHSTHTIEYFISLLRGHEVTAVADVRSVPASRFTPQFNGETIRLALEHAGIRYVFLGNELGARSSDPRCYIDGKVQYGRLSETPEFAAGIDRLIDGAGRERIAIMCTEQEPLDCHRTVLVSRVLGARGMQVSHIHSDGSLEGHDDAMIRLRAGYGLDQPTLLDSSTELLSRALALQEAKIAYVNTERVMDR